MNRRNRDQREKHRARQVGPGAPPGQLVEDTVAEVPTIRIMAYGPDQLSEEVVTDLRRVRELWRTLPVVWVHVEGMAHADTLRQLGTIFDLHPLALEDVSVAFQQRAKVEDYGDHLFIVARMAVPGEPITTEQFCLFLGADFVLTFEERSTRCFEPVRERVRHPHYRIRQTGPDFLADYWGCTDCRP